MTKITRRVFLARGASLGAAVGVTVVGLSACGGDEGLTCTDTSGLTPPEQATRSNLGYVDHSPHGTAKQCVNCNFYQPAAANACGGCTLVKGPIHPEGYCNSWAAKQS
ncbi:MAG: high-potential iron-sulfur protein [Myxococcota bacterium]